ncbi:hypothetical protein [Sinorhizobium sp. A49]|uniref:hypothetical protein n=1 Tax=Sinorhizobium sp. A49 TaxID=1945861 RepID=UPI00111585F8|nr:hypothetical protein [Sinorhizobium sp. A49]
MTNYFNKQSLLTFVMASVVGSILLTAATAIDSVAGLFNYTPHAYIQILTLFDLKFVLLLIAAWLVVLALHVTLGARLATASAQFLKLAWDNACFVVGAIFAVDVISAVASWSFDGFWMAAATAVLLCAVAAIGGLIFVNGKDQNWKIRIATAVGLLILSCILIFASTIPSGSA